MHFVYTYITTKLSNPNCSPEVCAQVSIIDFTVTQRGLEDQLLSLVIANERVVCFDVFFFHINEDVCI